MGILSDFKEFGFDGKGMDLFETEKKEQEIQRQKEKTPEDIELEVLFDKSYTCPVCDNKFVSKTVRTGKIKLLGSDIDLRPKHEQLDTLKYDAIVCHKCGYAAISRFFENMTLPQAKLIRENVSANYKDTPEPKGIYDYDYAIEMHKLALLNAVVKKARASEKAYICLKMAWLCRGKAENLSRDIEDYDEVVKQCKANERELLMNACQGFITAIETELFPMCGMDEITVDYLIAAIEMEIGEYEKAMKILSNIIVNREANARMKDRARALKEEIQKRRRQNLLEENEKGVSQNN